MNDIIKKAKAENRNLLEHEALRLFESYNISVPKYMLVHNKEQAIEAASKIGYPVVLKIVSKDILHKSDVGGVMVGLKTHTDVEKAYDEILENVSAKVDSPSIEGMLVVENVQKGFELVAGMVEDAQLGRAIMFGLGGIYVEVLKDVTFTMLPIDKNEALEMIKSIKSYKILNGYRGDKPKDIASIQELLTNLGSLALDNPEIKEIDINPFFVYEKGLKIVDARIII